MEEKIIVLNCHGSVEEIISSLKEVVSKMEQDYQTDVYFKFEEGSRVESNSKSVVMTILK